MKEPVWFFDSVYDIVRIIQQYPMSKKKAWRNVSYSEAAQYSSYFHKILSCIRCTETDSKF